MSVSSGTKLGGLTVTTGKRNVSITPGMGYETLPKLGIKRGDSPGGEPSSGAAVRDTALGKSSLTPHTR